MKQVLQVIAILIACMAIHADEWTIHPDQVYNLDFAPTTYNSIKLQIPLKAVDSPTNISMARTKGIIHPPAVALGPAVEITPQVELKNIATLQLPFEEGQLPLRDVKINIWYKADKNSQPVVFPTEQLKIDYKNKTVQLEIKNTGTYQVGTWQSLAENWGPASFSLQSPPPASSFTLGQDNDTITFTWQKAVDPNRDEVKYSIVFAQDSEMSIPLATIDCGNDNFHHASVSTLRTLLKNYLYTPIFWGVQASDQHETTLSLQGYPITFEDNVSRKVPHVIFDYESSWSYNDTQNLDGENWQSSEFDDTSWKTSTGMFGFGDWQKSSPTTKLKNSRTTYYFRKTVTLDEKPQAITMRAKYDDGFICYVNNVAVYHQNVKKGAKYNDNAAERNESIANFFIDGEHFQVGKNTIAIEVHQASFLSTDIAFDARMEKGQNAIAITWGPWLTLPLDNSITVVWQTSQRALSELHYGASKNMENIVKGTLKNNTHKLVAKNLIPGQRYYYKVISGSVHSVTKSFIAPVTKDTNIRVGMYGDSRTFHSFHQVVVKAIAKHQPHMIINSGDIIENGNKLHEWYEQFLTPAASSIDEIPFIACHGNHDGSIAGNMWDFVPLPENAPSQQEMYYYNFRYGPMTVMVIDTEADYQKGSTQYSYIERDLKKYHRDNWLVVVFHRPAYSSGVGHGGEESPKIAEELVVLLERYGADFVLNGHDHFYERSFKEGIHYILSGGGGAPSTFGGVSLNPYSVTYDNFVLCYNIMDISPYKCEMQTLTPEGKVLDSVVIDGRKPQIDVLQPHSAVERITKKNGKRGYYLDNESDAFVAKKGQVFRFYFRAKDLDNDARITLSLDKDTKMGNTTTIVEDLSEDANHYYDWQVPEDFPQGKYYIHSLIDDGTNTDEDYSHFYIVVK
ncbi:metallophosphoesterase [Candidatus Uabimicrobium sp. HlEnr_7]|uniref:metallophosphoesterase n=1 Tax=Candidatus Uabimicrobium helgolandensis TaxID=3095367 RepID=UPI0035566DA2